MTFGTEWRYDAGGYDHGRRPRNARLQRLLGGAALACVVLLCVWTVANLGGSGTDPIDIDGGRGDKLVAVEPRPPARANSYATLFDFRLLFDSRSLFDSRNSSNISPPTFARSAPPRAGAESVASASSQSAVREAQGPPSTPAQDQRIAQSAPPPEVRLPASRRASLHVRAAQDRAVADAHADAHADAPSIFEKLFGKPSPFTLAYASPDDGLPAGDSGAAGRYDRRTAVYDISAHKVYMPDGTTLEAHSGYGSMLDDPRYADAKNRGVTPPDVYDLQLREAPFHGVRALRLIPVDEAKVFGRSGLLAHSFMLGPNGDSNGCVSFRNYDAFLQAYLNHEIKRLVVVARLD